MPWTLEATSEYTRTPTRVVMTPDSFEWQGQRMSVAMSTAARAPPCKKHQTVKRSSAAGPLYRQRNTSCSIVWSHFGAKIPV